MVIELKGNTVTAKKIDEEARAFGRRHRSKEMFVNVIHCLEYRNDEQPKNEHLTLNGILPVSYRETSRTARVREKYGMGYLN